MKISEAQIKAIIEALAKELSERVKNVECSERDFMYENRFSAWGNGSEEGDIEGVLEYEGLPDVDYDHAEVLINCKYNIEYTVLDDYDAGDYWTAPSGGRGVDSAEGSIYDLYIEILKENDDKWEEVEVPADVLVRIENEVSDKAEVFAW